MNILGKISDYIYDVKRAYAYLSASATTTITTGGTFQYINGSFVNSPIDGFSVVAGPSLQYDGVAGYFEIDWHANFSSQDAGRTIEIGISINEEVLTSAHGSVMGMFAKYAAEILPLSGTYVVYLEPGDTIQLQVTSDTDADQVTFNHFTTTIRRFG